MGYYSDLQIRLTEMGLVPDSQEFLRMGKVLEAGDCAGLREVGACERCGDIGTAGCVWGERGEEAHGVIELTSVAERTPSPADTMFVVIDRVWGDRFHCADEADRDTALAAIHRRARAARYKPDFVVSTMA